MAPLSSPFILPSRHLNFKSDLVKSESIFVKVNDNISLDHKLYLFKWHTLSTPFILPSLHLNFKSFLVKLQNLFVKTYDNIS